MHLTNWQPFISDHPWSRALYPNFFWPFFPLIFTTQDTLLIMSEWVASWKKVMHGSQGGKSEVTRVIQNITQGMEWMRNCIRQLGSSHKAGFTAPWHAMGLLWEGIHHARHTPRNNALSQLNAVIVGTQILFSAATSNWLWDPHERHARGPEGATCSVRCILLVAGPSWFGCRGIHEPSLNFHFIAIKSTSI